jgi:hypothetical protein
MERWRTHSVIQDTKGFGAMITHIVLFKLEEPSGDNLATTRAKLLSMGSEIPLLRHLEVGIDVIRSERSYDIALVTKFDSLEELQAYQVHPYHAGIIVPHMKSVCSSIVAVDYQN